MPENDLNKNRAPELSVLITGGSGLVGKYLTSLLLTRGFKVSHLSRKANQFGRVRVYRWDPEKKIIDPEVFDGVDYIVHLAGANIGEKRWTKKRKKEIEESRIDSARLIKESLTQSGRKIRAFISASAIGYYGSVSSEKVFTEADPPGEDFLGNICRQWEEEADQVAESSARVVKIRSAVVLEKSDSALARILKPASLGIFPRLGKGSQYMPWIHIEDLCNIYLKAIEDDSMSGSYNAVSPQHVTQSEFMRTLAQTMKKRFFHPPVPALILNIILGKMSVVALKGSRISPEKLTSAGFSFKFSRLDEALGKILL